MRMTLRWRWAFALLTVALVVTCDVLTMLWSGPTPRVLGSFILPGSRLTIETALAALLLASSVAVSPVPHKRLVLLLSSFAFFLGNGRYLGSGDMAPTRVLPLIFLREHTLFLDSLHDRSSYAFTLVGSHTLSRYPIATSFLAIPFYLPSALGHFDPNSDALYELDSIAAAGLTSVSVLFLFSVFTQITGNERDARWVTLAYFAGTAAATIFGKALWQHTGAGFSLSLAVAGLYCVRTWWRQGLAVGLCAGLAVACRSVDIILAAALIAALAVESRKGAALAAGGVGFFLALVGLYNWRLFGSPLATGYGAEASEGWTGFWPGGLAGILVSPARGIFLYSPCLLFAVFALAKNRGMVFSRERMLLSGLFFYWLLLGKWGGWTGSYCASYRMVSDTLPLFAPGLALAWRERSRHRLQAACVWSVATQCLIAFGLVHGAQSDRFLSGEPPWSPLTFGPLAYVVDAWRSLF